MAESSLHIEAEKLNLLYQYNGTSYVGIYMNQYVVYPDYSHPNITTFIKILDQFVTKYVTEPIHGFILVDNWPYDTFFHMNGSDFTYFTEVITLILEEAQSRFNFFLGISRGNVFHSTLE